MAHRIERQTKAYRKALSQELKRLRIAAGLSVNRLAEDAHLSQAMISLIESDQRGPSVETLFRIALALGTTPDEILRAIVAAGRDVK